MAEVLPAAAATAAAGTRLTWVLPVAAGPAAAVSAALPTVSRRLARDNARQERILKL